MDAVLAGHHASHRLALGFNFAGGGHVRVVRHLCVAATLDSRARKLDFYLRPLCDDVCGTAIRRGGLCDFQGRFRTERSVLHPLRLRP